MKIAVAPPAASLPGTFFPLPPGQAFLWKRKAHWWASSFPYAACTEGHQVSYPFGTFPEALAVATRPALTVPAAHSEAFDQLARLTAQLCHPANGQATGWLFGFLGYDLKNGIEKLSSHHPDLSGFPDMLFFEPEALLQFSAEGVEITAARPVEIFSQIAQTELPEPVRTETPLSGPVECMVSWETYEQDVQAIRQHIEEGDVYELNYCVPFRAACTQTDPLALYHRLTALSPTPFAGWLKCGSRWMLCASPERFLKKEADLLISQPIKGTARRSTDPTEDAALRHTLLHSEKERAENMMIVDLVRNDLARSARKATVQVPELFGIYSFRQVHQMISTVTARLRPDVHPVSAIRHAFPMGSMTGAPKIMAMQLIERYEKVKRGLFSGAFGFFRPGQLPESFGPDFDFNVVIRSVFIDQSAGLLSFQAGSAITYDSDPAQEWAECHLKTTAILKALGHG